MIQKQKASSESLFSAFVYFYYLKCGADEFENEGSTLISKRFRTLPPSPPKGQRLFGIPLAVPQRSTLTFQRSTIPRLSLLAKI